MKNIKLIPFSFLILLLFTSCQKEDIMSYDSLPAVNFVNEAKTYSFLGNLDGESVQTVEVQLMGNAKDVDRYFNVEVVQDERTTASKGQYEILEGVVKAGEFIGTLSVNVRNSEELDTETVNVHLAIVDSEDFKVGTIEGREFDLSWTNQVVVPNWQWYSYFFTRVPSTAAYRAVVESTGLTQFERADYIAITPVGAEALGIQFGDYVKQYNLDNPGNPLRHDDGELAGLVIEPLFYTRSKYD